MKKFITFLSLIALLFFSNGAVLAQGVSVGTVVTENCAKEINRAEIKVAKGIRDTAMNSAKSIRDLALKSAKEIRNTVLKSATSFDKDAAKTAVRAAKSAYAISVRAAKDAYAISARAAKDAYAVAVNQPAKYIRNSALDSAKLIRDAAIESARSIRNAALEFAGAGWWKKNADQTAINAAKDAYTTAVNAAKDAYATSAKAAKDAYAIAVATGARCAQFDPNKPTNTGDDIISATTELYGKYENSKYGFTLNFPKTWEGYVIKERVLNWQTDGTSNSIDFGFSDQDSLFNISLHTKDQWQKIKLNEGPTPTYLGENSQFVFGSSGAQDAANDTIRARMKEVEAILRTFKLSDSQKTVLYSDTYYGVNFVTNKGCEPYLKVAKSTTGIMTGGDGVRPFEVTLPLAKREKDVWLKFEVLSNYDYSLLLAEALPKKLHLILELNNEAKLVIRGISPQWPSLTVLPANCRVRAEKITVIN